MATPIKIALTPAEFNRRAAQVSVKTGCPITSHNGTISYLGVTLFFDFDGVGELTLNIQKKPKLLTENYIASKVREWFQA